MERVRVSRAFDEGARTLLATDAAAEGLNLQQRCRVVVHYELPWNPSRLEQRAGRVDRIGQPKRVHEIGLVAASTAERLVVAPLTIRAARAHRDVSRTRMLDALTESRVAEAVMAGVSEIEALRAPSREHATGDTHHAITAPDAIREAARLENVRALLLRSSTSRETSRNREAPFVTRKTFRRSIHPSLSAWSSSLVLAYLISIQAEDGRPVHEEIFTLAIPAIDGGLPKHNGALRALVGRYTNPSGAVARTIERHGRAVVAAIEPAEKRRRSRLHDRTHAVRAMQRSTAALLVQLRLFSRRRRPAEDLDPISPPPRIPVWSPLQVRTRLAAAIRIERTS